MNQQRTLRLIEDVDSNEDSQPQENHAIQRTTSLHVNNQINIRTSEAKGTEETIHTEEYEANLTQIQKQKLSRLQDTFLEVMRKDIISALHPHYEGSLKLINEHKLLQIQKEAKLTHTNKLKLDEDGRIIMPKEYKLKVIVSIHIQNAHSPEEEDLRELKNFTFLDTLRQQIKDQLIVYRSSCMNCLRRPHSFRQRFNKVIEA